MSYVATFIFQLYVKPSFTMHSCDLFSCYSSFLRGFPLTTEVLVWQCYHHFSLFVLFRSTSFVKVCFSAKLLVTDSVNQRDHLLMNSCSLCIVFSDGTIWPRGKTMDTIRYTAPKRTLSITFFSVRTWGTVLYQKSSINRFKQHSNSRRPPRSTAIDTCRTLSNAFEDVRCVRTWGQSHSNARFQ